MGEERKITSIVEYLEKVSKIKEQWPSPVLALFPFQGSIGNNGNFGGNRQPGEKGYRGQAGFAVQLVRLKG